MEDSSLPSSWARGVACFDMTLSVWVKFYEFLDFLNFRSPDPAPKGSITMLDSVAVNEGVLAILIGLCRETIVSLRKSVVVGSAFTIGLCWGVAFLLADVAAKVFFDDISDVLSVGLIGSACPPWY